MTHGSVLGRAALFALPICAGNILQLLYSTVDTLVIGNFCDTTALASVATSSQPLEILLCVFVGIGSGISILVSQAVGRADHDQLQKLVRTSVWLLLPEHPVIRLAASIRPAPIPINFFIMIPPVFPYFKCTFTDAFIPNTRGRFSLFSMVTLMGISCVTLV